MGQAIIDKIATEESVTNTGVVRRSNLDSVDADARFVRRLEKDFPETKFVWDAPRFSCRFKNGVFVVFLGEPQQNFGLLALHELGHALCGHKDYAADVERLKIESEAWERAKTVYCEYKKLAGVSEMEIGGGSKGVAGDANLTEILPEWDEDFVQEKLDTYRDWLHSKSCCKKCGLTRYQTEGGGYHCPRCENFAGESCNYRIIWYN